MIHLVIANETGEVITELDVNWQQAYERLQKISLK